MKGFQKTQNGFGLMEIVISVAFISLFFTRFIIGGAFFTQKSMQSLQEVRANFLMEEGAEAIRYMRDMGWSNISELTPGTDYYLNFTGGQWATSTATSTIDTIFYRKFNTANVNRDANDNIFASGTDDPQTKLITVSVEWRGRTGTTTDTLQLYLTDI